MAILYTWEISNLKVEVNNNGLKDVVTEIRWILKATDDQDGTTVQTNGVEKLDPPESLKFISFEELTEEIVTGWLEASMVKVIEDPESSLPGNQKTYITIDNLQDRKNYLNDKIAQKKAPAIINRKPPWANSGNSNNNP